MSCPNCDTIFEENRKTPAPGDISMCLACGEVSVYQEDLSLRAITQEELVHMADVFPEGYSSICNAIGKIDQLNQSLKPKIQL